MTLVLTPGNYKQMIMTITGFFLTFERERERDALAMEQDLIIMVWEVKSKKRGRL